jgi:glyoxylase-like metal-dependent hydrolase (beta-lactamase superfamily II)
MRSKRVPLSSDLLVKQFPNGRFVQNSYLVGDPPSGDAILIDPGEDTTQLLAEVARGGWTVRAIWLTHAHVDHLLGVPATRTATGAPVLLHPADLPLYRALPQQAAWMGFSTEALWAPDGELAHGQVLMVGPHAFTVRHTPGHSPGSVCFVGADRVFVGDVLFAGSIGRTDLPGGDIFALMRSIHAHLLSLPDETTVHSGHGPDSTIGQERASNPFITGQVAAG